MKKLTALLLCLAMVFALCACGSEPAAEAPAESQPKENAAKPADPIVISISNAYSDLDQVNTELKLAAEKINERTDGAVVVNVYPNNTFGTITDGVEAITSNSPLLLVAGFGQWADVYPDGVALEAGFVYENTEEVRRLRETDFFKEIVRQMDEVNIHVINCSFIGGMRQVIGRKAYTTPAEIAGLKLRVPNSTAFLECFKAIGASPMGMASSEQLTALSAGTIDALDQSISLIYSTKSYELVKEVTLLKQMPLSDSIFCSTTWWNSLPEEYRAIIDEELLACGQRYYEYAVANESAMREEMEAAGVTFHEIDRAPFVELGKDLVLQYGIGQQVIDTVEEIRADMAAGK